MDWLNLHLQDSDAHYVNGHQIWEEILPFYDQYGPDIIGLPLTGVTVNDAKQRYEQYFEGIRILSKFFRSTRTNPSDAVWRLDVRK